MTGTKIMFEISWDVGVTICTILVTALLFTVGTAFLVVGIRSLTVARFYRGMMIAVGLLSLAVLIVALMYAPMKYSVTPLHLVISRLGPDVKLPLQDVVSTEIPDETDVFGSAVRLWGVGGLFGYYGKFSSPKLGTFRAYMTRRDKIVLVRLQQQPPLLLTPDDPEGFVSAVLERIENDGSRGNLKNMKNDRQILDVRCRQFFDAMSSNKGRPEKSLLAAILISTESINSISEAWTTTTSKYGSYCGCETLAVYNWQETDGVTVAVKFVNGEILHALFFDDKRKVNGFWNLGPSPARDTEQMTFVKEVEEKSFYMGKEPWRLGCTLTFKKLPTTKLSPGVILVHGSGPHDRDETLMAQKPFRDIAIGLAYHGVIVLRYDKRTFAYAKSFKEIDPTRITPHNVIIEDALTGLAYLESLEVVDANSLFVVGHSLGGYLAPAIAKEHGNIRGIAILASNSRPLYELAAEQIRARLRSGESIPFLKRKLLERNLKKIEQLKTGKLRRSEVLMGAPVSFWLELDKMGGAAKGKGLNCPIFVAYGGQDQNVSRIDYEGWKEALQSNDRVTFQFYDQLNHLFIRGSGAMNLTELAVPKHVCSTFTKELAEWIKRASALE